jgi:hypothetical protein
MPFRSAIYSNIPPAATRLRRDADVIDTLIKTHAIIHQANREIDSRGRVVTTLEDYAEVHELYHDLLSIQTSTGANTKDLKFLEEIQEHLQEETGESAGEFVTVNLVAGNLKRDPQAIRRGLQRLVRFGFMALDKKPREHRFYVSENPPPGAVDILPPPVTVAAWIEQNGGVPMDQVTGTKDREPGDDSGIEDEIAL